MLKLILCDYIDKYILAKGTIAVAGQGADAVMIAADRNDKEVTFENHAPFIDYIS